MLRQKILRKIYFTTMIVFILFVISSFTINKNISNIKVEYQTNLSSVYLLDDNNYLLEVSIVVKDNLMDSIPIVINTLKSGNKHYSGLRGILPNNTDINEIVLDNGILTIDFNKELLNINENLEEKVIESLVFSLLNFKEVKGIKILIDGVPLKNLPKTNIKLDDILTKDFGINKEYDITTMNDVQKVVLYYYEEKDSNKYYVPVTKYVNSKDDKVKIIIDNLKNNYLSETNLMSYLNEKVRLENYELKSNMVTLSFSNILDFSFEPLEEEVIYTLASSILESTDIEKVIFMQNDHILTIKNR